MANFSNRANFLTLIGAILATLAIGPQAISCQKCNCAPNLCCNQFGFCGTSNAYCTGGPQVIPDAPGSGGGGGVARMVTDAIFNGIVNQTASSCAGKGFYTRDAFLNAARSFPQFGTSGSVDDQKREIAAAFAHFTYWTGHFCYIENIIGSSNNFCDSSNKQYPCVPGKSYYGRGPLQISWNFNYGPAGQAIGFDGLGNPDIVAKDNTISFKTGLWFWMNNAHSIITSGQGFGATVLAINPKVCNGGSSLTVSATGEYYEAYCKQLGVDPGQNLIC